MIESYKKNESTVKNSNIPVNYYSIKVCKRKEKNRRWVFPSVLEIVIFYYWRKFSCQNSVLFCLVRPVLIYCSLFLWISTTKGAYNPGTCVFYYLLRSSLNVFNTLPRLNYQNHISMRLSFGYILFGSVWFLVKCHMI